MHKKCSGILRELANHLGHLIHPGKIELFDDRKIGGGSEWDPIIRAKLDAAKIIVPLISPNFLGSRYIQTVELPEAMARQKDRKATILPILLDHCDWQGLKSHGVSLSEVSFLPKDRNNNLKPLKRVGQKTERGANSSCPKNTPAS
jgi:TIR domain